MTEIHPVFFWWLLVVGMGAAAIVFAPGRD